MRGKFHPKFLFGPFAWPKKMDPYASDMDVLDAVRDRKKAMLFTGFTFSSIKDGNEGVAALLEAAFDRGLSVVIDNHNMAGLPKHHWEPNLYVLHLDQAWRVSALKALRDTAFVGNGRWSLSAEAQQSLLLGYTEKQRKRWIAWQRQRKAAQTCLDLYTMLTPEQLRTARKLGMRCFGTPEQMAGMTFFFPRNGTVPKENAHKLVPKGLTFARVGLELKATQQLFGPFKTWKASWMTVRITAAQAQIISNGLRSSVQLHSARGWK